MNMGTFQLRKFPVVVEIRIAAISLNPPHSHFISLVSDEEGLDEEGLDEEEDFEGEDEVRMKCSVLSLLNTVDDGII